jgi:NADH/NAD ratio-sensing transcriptional regulator Rex
MRRRIPKSFTPEQQALINYRQATLDSLLSQLHERMSYQEIADLLGVSSALVRRELAPQQANFIRPGKAWLVPKAIAAEFIRARVYVPARMAS